MFEPLLYWHILLIFLQITDKLQNFFLINKYSIQNNYKHFCILINCNTLSIGMVRCIHNIYFTEIYIIIFVSLRENTNIFYNNKGQNVFLIPN